MQIQMDFRQSVIDGRSIDWKTWLTAEDISKIVPAEALTDECRTEAMLGIAQEDGLTLPWASAAGRVLIRPGKLAVWTGWSRHGKTQMLKQLMLHAISRGERVLICSMEEEIRDVWFDLLRVYSGGPNPTPKAIDDFARFIEGRLWLYDQQGVVDANRMLAVLRYAGIKLGTTQAVVDSLMMLAVDRDDYDAQKNFVVALKSAAKDTKQTVHLVAHMRKRDGRTGDEAPGTLHDIAGGHEIGSVADYVFSVWRNLRKDTDGEKKYHCILSVEKQRGRINWLGQIRLKFHDESRQFFDGLSPNPFIEVKHE